MDLLVRRHDDRGEPPRRGELRGGQQQPRLADAGLALDGHPAQFSAQSHGQLLPDRRQLQGPSHNGAGRPPNLQGKP